MVSRPTTSPDQEIEKPDRDAARSIDTCDGTTRRQRAPEGCPNGPGVYSAIAHPDRGILRLRASSQRGPLERSPPTVRSSSAQQHSHAVWRRDIATRSVAEGRFVRSCSSLNYRPLRRDAPSCKPASGSSPGCRSWPGCLFSGRPRAVEIAGEAPKDGAAKSSRCLPRRSQTAGATTDIGIPRDRRRTTPRTRPAKVRGKSHQLLPRLPCQPPHRSSR
jgi:hypothetical protein